MTLLELAALVFLAAAGAGLTLYWRSARLRQVSRDRLDAGASAPAAPPPLADRPFPRRFRWVAPLAVLRALERRVPLETFRLFGAALAVHWEVGGSLAPILATVGRAVRDRIELARRINSLTTQARLSIGAVLGTTYFVALAVWRN